jgi:dihydrolipoamide dehydrogenase
MRITVLGGGPGGYVAALKAAQLGAKVTVIEKAEVGGTCLNWGCIPTKTLIASADALHTAKNLSDYGIDLDGTVTPNFPRIMERKNRVVSIQIKGIRGLFKSWGVTLVEGAGSLVSPQKTEIQRSDGTKETIEADKVIIATGSRPLELPALPFDGKRIISSNDAVMLSEIPKSLLIVGGGVIGSEFACLFAGFGTAVTIVEMLPRAVATEDLEISEQLEREFRKKKIKLITGLGVTRAEAGPEGMRALLTDGKEILAEKILVACGRSLNSKGFGLGEIGVETGPKGQIVVNEKMEANVENVYAVGDVVGGMLLAHKASREGIVAASNACGATTAMDYSVVPAAIFTSPEIGSVGLREHEATEKGMKVRTGHFYFRGLGKAHAMGEISGFFKIVADADSDRVLGGHIIGPHASDLIHEVAVAMKVGTKVRQLASTIHAHPTLSEGILEASEDVHGEAVHLPKK